MGFKTKEACIMMLLLLFAGGCHSSPRVLPSLSPLLSPTAFVPATSRLATSTPPSTETPILTATTAPTPIPTLTPMPKSDIQHTVKGWGSFPRIAAVTGEALYLVQGDTATLLLDFGDITDQEIHFYYDARTWVQLSPNGQYAAYLFDTYTGADVLGYVDIQSRENHILKVAGNLQRAVGKGDPSESITSFVWRDNQGILYAKLKSAPNLAELWSIDLQDMEETKLAGDRVLTVLGISPDKEQVLFLYGIPFDDSGGYDEELAVLDLASGVVTRLLPPEGAGQYSGKRYLSFTLVTMPDGTQRIVAAEIGPGMTVTFQKPVIWMVDPRNNSITAIWTIGQAKDLGTKEGRDLEAGYDCPRDFLWSPSSESKFVYLADGAVLGGVWMVDLKNDTAVQIVEAGDQILLVWSSDGIVTQSFPWFDKLTLWSETGEIIGEIEF